MTTAAQRERTQLRTKLYTGCMIPGSHGRGGARIPESSREANYTELRRNYAELR